MTTVGKHLIIELYDIQRHGTPKEIIDVMEKACIDTGATVLFKHIHPFNGGGVSGAVILAESHMSIHTWPEYDYAALDIFVCGECDPFVAVPKLTMWFNQKYASIKLLHRGISEPYNKEDEYYMEYKYSDNKNHYPNVYFISLQELRKNARFKGR